MSDELIFREVDEDVRAEQFRKLWKRYGAYVTGGVLGVALVVAGVKGWQYWRLKQAEAAGDRYLIAANLLAEDKKDEANKALAEIAGGGPPGFAALAKLRLAAEFAKSGSATEALKTFDEIANADDADVSLRNLARVRAALLAVDAEPLAAIEKRLSPLDVTEGSWRHSAKEIIAISAYRNGDLNKADRLYNELTSDSATPAGLRERARKMAEIVSSRLSARRDGAESSDAAETNPPDSSQ